MKTTILILSIIMCSSVSIYSQKNEELQIWNSQQDTALIQKKNNQRELDKPYSDRSEIYKFRRNLPLDPQKRSVQDSIAERKFPGSSRFYGRSLARDAYRHGYGDAFIIVPDTSSRQYLIIVNPITGEIRKH
jgi:hypothetical protein